MAASDTGGVKAFSIGRRMMRERERLLGMTDEERAWRAQWLKDQILAPDEPVINEAQAYVANYNPIRRFYRAPLDKFADILTPYMTRHNALITRYLVGKAFIAIGFTYATFYYFKYNKNDWTRKSGWRVLTTRERVLPGHPEYPKLSDRSKPRDYASRGFQQSPI